MGIDFTPLVRGGFVRRARRTDSWAYDTETLQKEVLRSLCTGHVILNMEDGTVLTFYPETVISLKPICGMCPLWNMKT